MLLKFALVYGILLFTITCFGARLHGKERKIRNYFPQIFFTTTGIMLAVLLLAESGLNRITSGTVETTRLLLLALFWAAILFFSIFIFRSKSGLKDLMLENKMYSAIYTFLIGLSLYFIYSWGHFTIDNNHIGIVENRILYPGDKGRSILILGDTPVHILPVTTIVEANDSVSFEGLKIVVRLTATVTLDVEKAKQRGIETVDFAKLQIGVSNHIMDRLREGADATGLRSILERFHAGEEVDIGDIPLSWRFQNINLR